MQLKKLISMLLTVTLIAGLVFSTGQVSVFATMGDTGFLNTTDDDNWRVGKGIEWLELFDNPGLNAQRTRIEIGPLEKVVANDSSHPAAEDGVIWGFEIGFSFAEDAEFGVESYFAPSLRVGGSEVWNSGGFTNYEYTDGTALYMRKFVGENYPIYNPTNETILLEATFGVRTYVDSEESDQAPVKIEYIRFLDQNGNPYLSDDEYPEFGLLPGQTNPDPETDSESDPVTDSESDPVTDSESDPVTDSESDPVTDSESDPVTDSESDPVTDSESDPVTDSESDPEGDTSGEDEPAAPGVVDPGEGWNLVREWDFGDPGVDMSAGVISGSGGASAVLDTSVSPSALKVSGAGAETYDGVIFKNSADFSLFDVNKKYKIITSGKMGGDEATAEHAGGISVSMEYQGHDANATNWNQERIPKVVLPGEAFEFEEVFTEAAAFGGFDFIDDFRIVLSERYDPKITFYLDYYGIFESTEGGGEPEEPYNPPPAVPTIPVMTFSFQPVSPGQSFSDTTPVSGSGASVPYRTFENNAILRLNESKISEIIAKAEEGTAIIDLSGVSGAEKVTVLKSALYAIANSSLDVEFILPDGKKLTIPAETAKSIALAAKTGFVTFVLTEIDLASLSPVDQLKFGENDIIFDFAVMYDTYTIDYGSGIKIGFNAEDFDPDSGKVWIKDAKRRGVYVEIPEAEVTYNEATGEYEFEIDKE
ncbi:MAG: MSCRAMM family adhesin SdrC [Clostridiales bacterium]|nr:MSCRAMM family adhesin SdrC [Clostridiales bacterium]